MTWTVKVANSRKCLSQKRDEIKLRSQQITSRKSYMGFWSLQKSMTLNDLELSQRIYSHQSPKSNLLRAQRSARGSFINLLVLFRWKWCCACVQSTPVAVLFSAATSTCIKSPCWTSLSAEPAPHRPLHLVADPLHPRPSRSMQSSLRKRLSWVELTVHLYTYSRHQH